MVDFEPLELEVLNGLLEVDVFSSFNLLVKATVEAGVQTPLSVYADLYLSDDPTLSSDDYFVSP